MPICIKCLEDKPREVFQRRGNSIRGECIACGNKRKLAWRHANPERVKEITHKCYAKRVGKPEDDCRQKVLTEEERKARCLASKRKHYQKHRAEYLAREKKRQQEKPAQVSLAQARWRAANADKKRVSDTNWRRNNPSSVTRYSNDRRAREIQAQPSWLTPVHLAQIQEVYDISAARQMQTGVKHHVDHIVPLKGKAVRGLHVPWNLSPIPSGANQSKGNRMPTSPVATPSR